MVVHVWLVKRDGSMLQSYTTEARMWENAVLDILSWLRIEVLPYWKPGDLALAWNDNTLDACTAGALYGIAVSNGLRGSGVNNGHS